MSVPVFVVGKVEEFDFEGVIVALETKGNFVVAIGGLDGLGGEALVENIGEEPGTEGVFAVKDFNISGGGVDGFLGIVGCLGYGGDAHFSGDAAAGGGSGFRCTHELGVGVKAMTRARSWV